MVTPTIPQGEPAQLVVGDSAKWYVQDLDYLPTDGWTMAYYLVNKDSSRVTFSGVTDNADGRWLVTVAKTDTQALIAGRWNWQRVATKAAEQVTRGQGEFEVIAGFATVGSQEPFVDGRSWARQALDKLEAAYLAQATSGQISVGFNGRSITWASLAELRAERDAMRAKVQTEAGGGKGRDIRVRYG